MDSLRSPQAGLTLIALCVIVVILILLAAIAVPGFLPASRGNPEPGAWATLRTLVAAEADFRANDRDWNHVPDYWTADVKGLYTMTSAAVRGAAATTPTDPAIKLIDLSVASADADGTMPPAGGENSPLSLFAVPSAKAGYWFGALDFDATVGPGNPESFYRQDTGGDPLMGRVHHLGRFGFVAFPDSPSSGKYVYIVNERGTVYQRAVRKNLRPSNATPPGLGGALNPYLKWPREDELKSSWEKVQ